MKLSILSTFSVIACAFIGFVFASPVDSTSLVASDATGDQVISIITDVKTKLEACHTKWKNTCGSSCGSDVVSSWGNECAAIVNEGKNACQAIIPIGWIFASPGVCISLLATIIEEICKCLTFFIAATGIIGTLIMLLGGVVSLVAALNALLALLGGCIPGLLSLILAALGGLICWILALLGL